MISLPQPGSVCAYSFTTGFASLNGIYTLTEVLSFSQALASGVDFVADLYTPAGLTAGQYTTDAPSYATQSVLALTPANAGGAAIYAPAGILAMLPDPMIGCYNQLAIGVNLGLFEDQVKLTWIIDQLNAIIGGAVGVTAPVKLYSLGTQYLRVADYAAIVAARTAAQQETPTLYQQLQAQIALTTAAQTLNQAYETTFVALAS